MGGKMPEVDTHDMYLARSLTRWAGFYSDGPDRDRGGERDLEDQGVVRV